MYKPALPDPRRIRKWPRKLGRFIGDQWWPIASSLMVIAVISLLLGFNLLGLTQGHLSASESIIQQHLVHRDLGIKSLLRNPVNLPYFVWIYALEKAHVTSIVAGRVISAAYGGLAVISFYYILKLWHTRRAALLGTTLFATAAWTLHIGRLGTPEVLLMTPMILVLCGTWLETSAKRKWVLSLCLVTAMALMYVPGMIFFVVSGAAWQARRIIRELRRTARWFVVLWALLGVILLVPLGWMLISAPHNALTLVGLPSHLPNPKQFGLNLAQVPTQFAARGPKDPLRWLGRLPLLDLFSGTMVLVGIFAYAFRFRLDRTKLLAGSFVAGSLLIALGGSVTISLLVPFVYIVAAGGITLMLQQWLTVFPRNPFARTLATTLMSIVVLLSAFYNINHYFIAWPNAPETRAVFSKK